MKYNCFVCKAELNDKFERFDVYNKYSGGYSTVSVCERCARKSQDKLEREIEQKLKNDYS